MSNTEAAATFSSSATISRQNWLVTGVVVASPATGEIKAIMPIFNSYSDIHIESIVSFDAPQDMHQIECNAEAVAAPTARKEDGAPQEKDHNLRAAANVSPNAQKNLVSVAVKKILDLDLQNIAVMIGLASLAGSLTNTLFSAVSGNPAPQALIMLVVLGGFVGGKFLSGNLRSHEHG